MTIDPVAVYAAVVASAALGWQVYQQVYQWRLDRRGDLDLQVDVGWTSDGTWSLLGMVVNTNDYPVRLTELRISTYIPDERSDIRNSRYLRYLPGEMGLPPEVPAHDSVTFARDWNLLIASLEGVADAETGEVVMPRRGYGARVRLTTSLGREFTAATPMVGVDLRDTPGQQALGCDAPES